MLHETRGLGRRSLPGQDPARAHWDGRLGAEPGGPEWLGVVGRDVVPFRSGRGWSRVWCSLARVG